jgi:hypothetical protein
MVATTMPHTRELLSRLRVDYPGITFIVGDDFKWSKANQKLTFIDQLDQELYLLHELAHALLGHSNFTLDVQLLSQEREAWDYARSMLAPQYSIRCDEELIQDTLDTYREWLHQRSLCPSCGFTGLQNKTSIYRCLNCRCSWRSNDARRCVLRRYKLT